MQFWLTILIQGLLWLRQGRQQCCRQRSAVPHRSEALQKQNQHPSPGGNPTATPWDSSWEAVDFTSGHSAMLLLQQGQAPFCCTGLWGSHWDAQPTCGHWWVHPMHNHGWSEVSLHWTPQRFGSRHRSFLHSWWFGPVTVTLRRRPQHPKVGADFVETGFVSLATRQASRHHCRPPPGQQGSAGSEEKPSQHMRERGAAP